MGKLILVIFSVPILFILTAFITGLIKAIKSELNEEEKNYKFILENLNWYSKTKNENIIYELIKFLEERTKN